MSNEANMPSGSEWVLEVVQEGRERRFAAAELPVSAGGDANDDIRLPGVADSVNVSALDGVFFVQPRKNSRNARLNGERLIGSKRLGDGDVIALGTARLACSIADGRLRLAVDAVLTAGTTTPPDLEDLARASSIGGDEVAIEPISFRTQQATAEHRSYWPSKAAMGLTATFAVLAFCGWFAFTARSVQIKFVPSADEVSLPSTLLKLRVGDRYLLMSGRHDVAASLAGYYPFESEIDVGRMHDQSFEFKLTKLPGIVAVTASPDVGASVSMDGMALGAAPLTDIEVTPGKHEFVFAADRFFDRKVELDVEGGGVHQSVDVTLEPNWAPVDLATTPAGADVFVDGEVAGKTPVELELEQGTHTVEVRHRGYNAWHDDIDVVAGQPLSLPPVSLVEADGRIELASEPSEAAVTVNGNFVGRTPIELSLRPGRTHQIVLSKPGHEPVVRELSVAADSGRRVVVKMPGVYGQVGVTSSPPDAEILVDDQLAGRTPKTLSLMAVPHTVVVRSDGYAEKSEEILPRSDYPLALDFELEKLNELTGEGYSTIITTDQGQKLKLMPAAKFTMGSSRREVDRRSNETQRQVEISTAYYLGEKEVTNAEFREFKPDHDSGEFAEMSLNEDDQPVVNVSWDEVVQYLNWLSIKDALQPVYRESKDGWVAELPLRSGYRLPTEAEWAHAERFADPEMPLLYPWGADLPPPDRSGNFADISASEILPTTLVTYNDGYPVAAPVGSFTHDSLGFYDLGGNVVEWMHDFYEIGEPFYADVLVDPLGPESGTSHVIRGSGWKSATNTELRAAYRSNSSGPRDDLGFRIARNLE